MTAAREWRALNSGATADAIGITLGKRAGASSSIDQKRAIVACTPAFFSALLAPMMNGS